MEEILLIYDKQCPACDYYCNIVNIREDVGTLTLVDARDASDVMNQITAKGWDIDQGMVVKAGDVLYYGADAIHTLSLMGSQAGWFNRLNYWIFRSKTRAKILYPLLKSLRNVLLKTLGVSKINNLGFEGNDRF